MNLSYNGALSPFVVANVIDMLRSYPSVMEMREYPDSNLTQELFSDLTWTHHGEDCMGQATSTERRGTPFGWLAKEDGSGGFLFMESEAVRQRLAQALSDLVIDEHPFSTVIPIDDHVGRRILKKRPGWAIRSCLGMLYDDEPKPAGYETQGREV